MIDYTRKLEELSCWVENIENAQDEKPTVSHEEKLQQLMASLIFKKPCFKFAFIIHCYFFIRLCTSVEFTVCAVLLDSS